MGEEGLDYKQWVEQKGGVVTGVMTESGVSEFRRAKEFDWEKVGEEKIKEKLKLRRKRDTG